MNSSQSLPHTENIHENKIENKIRIELDDNDYFLKGFLIGYQREKDRIHEFRAKKEETSWVPELWWPALGVVKTLHTDNKQQIRK